MSESPPDGSFPEAGPLPYLLDDEAQAREALGGPRGGPRRWFHATNAGTAFIAVRQGLVPSCWRGGDCCAVCGYAELDDVHSHQGPWVLEIVSPALPGQVKAWWVPPSAIQGGWLDGSFTTAEEMRASAPPDPGDDARPCSCGLSKLVAEQIRAWRRARD